MNRIRHRLFMFGRELHTRSHDGPSEALKRKVAELEKTRKMRTSRKKDQFFVKVPESAAWLDTATPSMFLAVAGIALFAKLLMMYDDSKSQELLERKIKHAPEGQGTVRMLTREEWEEFREVRPRTPFESKLARPNARIRTGEPLRLVSLVMLLIHLAVADNLILFYISTLSRVLVFGFAKHQVVKLLARQER